MVNEISFIRNVDWHSYFESRRTFFERHAVIFAQGGTLDAIYNEVGRLVPIPHPLSINSTNYLVATEIAQQFAQQYTQAKTLGELYPWSTNEISWQPLKAMLTARISSFDSGQEEPKHFVAALAHHAQVIQNDNVYSLIHTQGTDTLVHKATLFSLILLKSVIARNQKIVFIGSPESGYVPNSIATYNITGGIFTAVDESVPAGIYTVSSTRKGHEVITHILPALGAVKLHADGYFHGPNSGAPPMTIYETGKVIRGNTYELLLERSLYADLLPDLNLVYLQNTASVNRLEQALQSVSFVSVEEDPNILSLLYKRGKRAFVVEARGAGNAPLAWKNTLQKIMQDSNVTTTIITSADSGDIDVRKYAAGLDIAGILSGRTLRKEAALLLTGIIHDLKMHKTLDMETGQQLIELYCYCMGMITLSPDKLQPITL